MQMGGADVGAAGVIAPEFGSVDIHQGSLMGVVVARGSREAGMAWHREWCGTVVVRRGC